MSLSEEKIWWAMSAVYNRSVSLHEELSVLGIESFVPQHYELRVVNGRKVRRLVPVIRNLIFIRTSTSAIRVLKESYSYLQYLVSKCDGQSRPIVVPEAQMRHFIAVAGTNDDHLIYLSPEEVDFRKGDRVRIHGGMFDGVEGVFLRVKGARDRRVVVSISGVSAVATASVHPDLLERL